MWWTQKKNTHSLANKLDTFIWRCWIPKISMMLYNNCWWFRHMIYLFPDPLIANHYSVYLLVVCVFRLLLTTHTHTDILVRNPMTHICIKCNNYCFNTHTASHRKKTPVPYSFGWFVKSTDCAHFSMNFCVKNALFLSIFTFSFSLYSKSSLIHIKRLFRFALFCFVFVALGNYECRHCVLPVFSSSLNWFFSFFFALTITFIFGYNYWNGESRRIYSSFFIELTLVICMCVCVR